MYKPIPPNQPKLHHQDHAVYMVLILFLYFKIIISWKKDNTVIYV